MANEELACVIFIKGISIEFVEDYVEVLLVLSTKSLILKKQRRKNAFSRPHP